MHAGCMMHVTWPSSVFNWCVRSNRGNRWGRCGVVVVLRSTICTIMYTVCTLCDCTKTHHNNFWSPSKLDHAGSRDNVLEMIKAGNNTGVGNSQVRSASSAPKLKQGSRLSKAYIWTVFNGPTKNRYEAKKSRRRGDRGEGFFQVFYSAVSPEYTVVSFE